MSISITYSAVPPTSTLYSRLQNERELRILFTQLFVHGCGIFRFFEIDPEEINEIFHLLIKASKNVFVSPKKMTKVFDDLRFEIYQTRQAYPGIEDRHWLLEKSVDEVEVILVQQFRLIGIQDPERLVEELIFGDKSLKLNSQERKEDPLGVISLELVHRGAGLLRLVNLDDLYALDEWTLENLREWRNLYFLSDELNEEIFFQIV
jgi:hypothetical protein